MQKMRLLRWEKKDDGTYLMTKSWCWLAVYRVLVDFGIIKAYEFKEFASIIRRIFHGEKLRVSINGKYMQTYSTKDDIFSCHHREWHHFHGKGDVTDHTFEECRAVVAKYFHIFNLKYNLMNKEKREKPLG